jgi:hypothetical protein
MLCDGQRRKDEQTGTPNYEMSTVGERGKERSPKMNRTGH